MEVVCHADFVKEATDSSVVSKGVCDTAVEVTVEDLEACGPVCEHSVKYGAACLEAADFVLM